MAKQTNPNKETNEAAEPKGKRDWKAIGYRVRNALALTLLSAGFIGFIVQNLNELVKGNIAYAVASVVTLLVLYFGLAKN